MKRAPLFVLVVLVVIVFLIYQFFPAAKQPPVVIAVSAFHSSLLPIVASKKDFFSNHGLNVELKVVEYGAVAIDLLKQGKVDYAVGYTTPVVLALAEGFDFKILTQLHRAANNTFLVLRKTNAIQKFEDLKGRRIGLIKNTNAEFFLNLLIQLNYLEREDIQVVYFEGDQHIKAILDGLVDAIIAWHPRGDELVAGHHSEFEIITSPLYSDYSLLVTSQNRLLNHPQEATSLLQGLLEAQAFFEENKDAAYEITLNKIGQVSTPDNLSRWKDISFIIEFTNVFHSMLEAELEWAFARQKKKAPAVESFIESKPLRDLEPDRVILE